MRRTQVGARFHGFTINKSIPPARPLFNLYLSFSLSSLSHFSYSRFNGGQTMDGNESNAHCDPRGRESDCLTEGSDCEAPTPATSAMNGLNH